VGALSIGVAKKIGKGRRDELEQGKKGGPLDQLEKGAGSGGCFDRLAGERRANLGGGREIVVRLKSP